MRRVQSIGLLSFVGLACAGLWAALSFGVAQPIHAQGASSKSGAVLSEGVLRRAGVKVVVPEFPAESVRANQSGVAVAKIDLNQRGELVHIDILQAPSKLIAEAVRTAVLQWKFSPVSSGGEPIAVSGKLTYYFLIQNRKPIVLDPMQAGFVGRQNTNITTSPSCKDRQGR